MSADPTIIATLDTIQMSDGRFAVDVLPGTVTGEVLDDLEGASTITLNVRDAVRSLLLSPLITDFEKPGREVDIQIPGEAKGDKPVWYRLVQVKKSGRGITLVFEDRSVTLLRAAGLRKGRIYRRGTYTRVQAAVALIRLQTAPRITVIAPELAKTQPIAKSQRELDAARGPGFVSSAGVTVKKVTADSEQLKVLAGILDVGVQMKAKRPVLISAVMATTQEATARNLPGGDRDSVGPFQIRELHIPRGEKDRRRDIAWAARWYFTRAIPEHRKRPSIKPNDLAQTVERSAHPLAYQAWAEEAEATVDAYLGRETVSTARRSARTTAKYTFVKKAHTSIWDTLDTWFKTVNWRRFAVANKVYLISDNALMNSRPQMRISEDDDAVESLGFDIDRGKPVDKASLVVRGTKWTAPVGSIIELYDVGPADGRWLVAQRRRSLASTQISITLKRPSAPLPEPAATETEGPGLGVDVQEVDDAFTLAEEIDKANMVYVWGGGHAKIGVASMGPQGKGYDCSGLASAIAGKMGVLNSPTDTVGFGRLGKPGKGKYVTFYVRPYSGAAGHIYMVFHRPGGKDQRFEAHGPRGARIGFMPRGGDQGYQARHFEGF